MDEKLRQELADILESADIEARALALLRRSLAVDIPQEDGLWVRALFNTAAVLLRTVYGDEAETILPWLLFCMGVAYAKRGSI